MFVLFVFIFWYVWITLKNVRHKLPIGMEGLEGVVGGLCGGGGGMGWDGHDFRFSRTHYGVDPMPLHQLKWYLLAE